MDMVVGGTIYAQFKNEAIDKIEKPNTWGDFRMLIGIFGLYRQFMPLYELYIRPWRYIFSKQPQPETLSKKEEMELIQNIWNLEDQILLKRLNIDILSGPSLARTDPSRIFYIKTYWYKDGILAVLLQEDVSEEAIKSESQ